MFFLISLFSSALKLNSPCTFQSKTGLNRTHVGLHSMTDFCCHPNVETTLHRVVPFLINSNSFLST